MGDGIRAHFGGVTMNPRHGSYGRNYARNVYSGAGQGGWESIEMEDMMHREGHDDEDDK